MGGSSLGTTIYDFLNTKIKKILFLTIWMQKIKKLKKIKKL